MHFSKFLSKPDCETGHVVHMFLRNARDEDQRDLKSYGDSDFESKGFQFGIGTLCQSTQKEWARKSHYNQTVVTMMTYRISCSLDSGSGPECLQPAQLACFGYISTNHDLVTLLN